ncbi:unnamed protein product [Pedinophyceae sp. YPF-701]|nr:unnamed protein product [Pedinophyceae sp. YPF-701]
MVRLIWRVPGQDRIAAAVSEIAHPCSPPVTSFDVFVETLDAVREIEAILTMPTCQAGGASPKGIGVIFAPGSGAQEYKGRLMSQLAHTFAQAGCPSVRYTVKAGKVVAEARRSMAFRLALDTLRSSPHVSGIKRWVVLASGTGARVAANIGKDLQQSGDEDVVGYVFFGCGFSSAAQEDLDCLRDLQTCSQRPCLFYVPSDDSNAALQGLRAAPAASGCPMHYLRKDHLRFVHAKADAGMKVNAKSGKYSPATVDEVDVTVAQWAEAVVAGDAAKLKDIGVALDEALAQAPAAAANDTEGEPAPAE